MKAFRSVLTTLGLFRLPIIIAACIGLHLVLQSVFLLTNWANWASIVGVLIGSIQLAKNTYHSIKEKQIALDYVAIAAIAIALYGQYFLVANVIILMLSGGYALESYGVATAKRSLTALIDRIPHDVHLWTHGQIGRLIPVKDVEIGQEIAIRKGEVIPLDGILSSTYAETDESSITGEPYLLEKQTGDQIRSGTVNVGDLIVVRVTTNDQNSTYNTIIKMVRETQQEKSPMIRLADQYSLVFLGFTFVLAIFAYVISHDIGRVLSVLVIATPCPLILATPIALMGGVSAGSRRNIIIKRLSSLEVLARVTTLVFDKTGTLTLGKPTVVNIIPSDPSLDVETLIGISAAIERNSLHPLAKAIVNYAKINNIPPVTVTHLHEKIGFGIYGTVDTATFHLSKIVGSEGMSIGLFDSQNTILLQFEFEDRVKSDSHSVLKSFDLAGHQLFMFTGDKKHRAEALVANFPVPVTVVAECTPDEKKDRIVELRNQGKITAMIGDGINDSPALAAADVGMVFSHDEQTASTDAADIVFLGGNLGLVLDATILATSTIRVAKQCIWFGIGASAIGMIAATLGFIPPIIGAILQEAIDVVVILYALRTSFISFKN